MDHRRGLIPARVIGICGLGEVLVDSARRDEDTGLPHLVYDGVRERRRLANHSSG